MTRKEIQEKYAFLKPTDIRVGLMAFGFECGKGWDKILEKLFSDIDSVLTPDEKKEFRVTQVKEKFGGLRVYTNFGDDKIWDLISKAEDESYKTCEECGSKWFVTQSKGWIVSLCLKCMIKYKIRRMR